MGQDSGLDSWFIHEKLVLNLLPRTEAAALVRGLCTDPTHPLAAAARVDAVEHAVARYLATHYVDSLDIQLARGSLIPGQLVWIEQAIAFKALREALQLIEGTGQGWASFSARLASDRSIRIRGSYNAARLTCHTARIKLSGTRRHFMLGYVTSAAADEIGIRPILIATRWLRPFPNIADWHPVDPAYLWPGAVDQFAAVDFSQRLTKADLVSCLGSS